MVQKNINAHLNKVQQQEYGGVNGILALSYNELPFHLKPCFLYLGHYPEDSEISKKELIRLWIAEGFISPSLEGGEMLMEDVAEQYLEELINRCLVQVSRRGHRGTSVKTCRIHDLLRDLCVSKAQEENFFQIIQPPMNGNENRSLDLTVATVPKVRRIAVYLNERYLGIQCQGVDLPRSIGKLKNLHTLFIQVSGGAVKIPSVLSKLQRLRHLVLTGHWRNWPVKWPEIKRCSQGNSLKNIETLKYIRIENLTENNALLKLTNIRNLGIQFERSEDVEAILKSPSFGLRRLRSLRMLLEGSIPFPELEQLSQCHHLSKLFLRGQIQEDPNSSHHVLEFLPTNICKLTLWQSLINEDPMPVLEKLPHLRILILKTSSYTGTKMSCSVNGFPQLDSLHIHGSNLKEWQIEEGAMPRLRSLYLVVVPGLKMVPEGLRYITTLQEMYLHGMNRSLVERIRVRDGREGEDFYKVRHVLSIRIF
ncbi:hypothetical protein QQP08_004114 [Theobroma cacao]|nr:hypothetical protein QQP08_004114 [Theobroma cacao]